MPEIGPALAKIFEGWGGYHASVVRAIAPRRPDQLTWRQSRATRSLGETARHISTSRIEWFLRMGAPGSRELADRITGWEVDEDGNRNIIPDSVVAADDAAKLVHWLEVTWEMIDRSLQGWHVEDLWLTYRHKWQGETYAVSRQWTIWRIMAHDIHHGGQIARMLALQDIEAFELRDLGGHVVLPPLARD